MKIREEKSIREEKEKNKGKRKYVFECKGEGK